MLLVNRNILYRCDNNVEFFHYIEWFPKYSASGIEFNGYERLGRRMHVLHLRQFVGIRLGELRRTKTFGLAVAHYASEQRSRLQTYITGKMNIY